MTTSDKRPPCLRRILTSGAIQTSADETPVSRPLRITATFSAPNDAQQYKMTSYYGQFLMICGRTDVPCSLVGSIQRLAWPIRRSLVPRRSTHSCGKGRQANIEHFP